ncbi:protein LATERAL ROOT PRIMORDIUM 1-like [Euphorbia lathyris]|uniref:protein LATERAL ROOT PRIMORDIUM 1-like n=1 Tax=Euphorbia lathyris TaxID=212925 RepID=UPI003313756A
MLGLHNIFLIAPPPIFPYSSHQIPNFNDDDNIPNSQYSWTNLKRYHHHHQQESSCARKEYSLNLGEDFENSNACKDCGNRAKKECEFRRCRTCCKSKGFGCATHVKSTWVSAARRKEVRRGGGGDGDGGGNSGTSSGGGGCKRPRENLNSASNSFSTSDNNVDAGSNFQDARFKQSLPRKVEAEAVLRCIRVAAIDGGEAEVAYQAMVNISGHIFKGFLYNQKNEYSRRNRDSTSPIVHQTDSSTQKLLNIASR